MKAAWVKACVERSMQPAEFYTGCRKIHTGVMLEFPDPFNDASETDADVLRIEDCGFTKAKLGMLRRLYWDEEHAEKVAHLWKGRLNRGKYGSVSVSTYHHITKSDPEKRSKRASVMGPCLTGVSFTLLNKREVAVDAFYRTTELFKKFPADLVFIRDTVAPAILGEGGMGQVTRLRCHFANVTSHPMYAVTWLPLVGDAEAMIAALDSLKDSDPRFYKWTMRWTSRYLLKEHEHGIAKFAQALRVQKDALSRFDSRTLKVLRSYLRDNHPGYDRASATARTNDDLEDGDDE